MTIPVTDCDVDQYLMVNEGRNGQLTGQIVTHFLISRMGPRQSLALPHRTDCCAMAARLQRHQHLRASEGAAKVEPDVGADGTRAVAGAGMVTDPPLG